jgi:hypothetical protein
MLSAIQGCASGHLNYHDEPQLTNKQKTARAYYASMIEYQAEEMERDYFVPGLLTNSNRWLDKEGEFYVAAERYNSNYEFRRYTDNLCKMAYLSNRICQRIKEMADRISRGEYDDPITIYYRELQKRQRDKQR